MSSEKSDVQRCIEGLQAARKCDDPRDREALASMVLPDIRELENGHQLADQIEYFVAADQIDHAILLLQKKPRHRVPFIVLFLLVPLGIAFFFVLSPLVGGHRDAAVVAVSQCPHAIELLGRPIEAKMGCNLGNSEEGTARWTVPVAGSSGEGRLSYFAERLEDGWDVLNAHIRVDGRHYLVVPCVGEVSESDAEGELQQGFNGVGTVADVTGKAPVATGDTCDVRVSVDPRFPNVIYNCKIEISCAGSLVYGATDNSGYAFCNVYSGSPIAARDEVGTDNSSDPMLDMDLNRGVIKISNEVTGSTYQFTIIGL